MATGRDVFGCLTAWCDVDQALAFSDWGGGNTLTHMEQCTTMRNVPVQMLTTLLFENTDTTSHIGHRIPYS